MARAADCALCYPGMNEDAAEPVLLPNQRCLNCSEPLIEGKPFCRSCGAKAIPSSTISTIDTYIQNKLTRELSTRLKEQSNIVRELADKAEDTLGNRLKRYTIIIGIAAAILAFFRLKPLYEIYAQIKPMVKAAEDQIAQITKEVGLAKAAVDRLSSDVAAQRARVTDRNGEISRKFQSLDAAANGFSERLEAMEKAFESKFEQVSQQLSPGVQAG